MYFLEVDSDRIIRVDQEPVPYEDASLRRLVRGEPAEVFRVPAWGRLCPGYPQLATGHVIGYARADAQPPLQGRSPGAAPFSVNARIGDVETPVYGLLVVVARDASGRLRDLTFDEADGFRLDKRTRTPILWMRPRAEAE